MTREKKKKGEGSAETRIVPYLLIRITITGKVRNKAGRGMPRRKKQSKRWKWI